MKNFILIFFLISGFFVFSQSFSPTNLKDLRSYDEHLENAKKLMSEPWFDGYLEMAYLEVKRAIWFKRFSSEAYSIKGQLNFRKGNYYKALEELNRSIALGSKSGCTYLYRAMTRIKFPKQHENYSESKYCADLMVAKALGGCTDQPEGFNAALQDKWPINAATQDNWPLCK
jgi:tetratricopeptide (TPR) repeat protein|tara:strand:- start:1444 stop:1959 length:516 start_codon:yes stop_codon:yes gene_type:complete